MIDCDQESNTAEIDMETPSHSKVHDYKINGSKQRRSTEILTTKSILEAPVFKPNNKEFSNITKYLKSIWSQIKDYGICKIIPPANWEVMLKN